jgi:malonyl-CoA/methylmalonyl-CoA synthetase
VLGQELRLGQQDRLQGRHAACVHARTTTARGSLLERARAQPTSTCRRAGADDLAAILYTSGTTGRSKGAMLTPRQPAAQRAALQGYWGWQPGDVLIHALPIFHVHGLFVASHGALLQRQQDDVVLEVRPRAVIARCPRPRCSWACRRCTCGCSASRLTREACRNMRLFISGSAPLLIETFNDLRERTGHTILERYGMSETVMLTSNPYTRRGERRGGTVGFPLPGVACACDDEGRSWPAGEIGGIEVQGRTCSAATGACRRRRRKSSPPTAGSRPATSASSTRRLRRHRRPQQGPDHHRRLQRLPRGDRGLPQRDARRGRERVIGVPHRDFGEGVVAVVVRKRTVRMSTRPR